MYVWLFRINLRLGKVIYFFILFLMLVIYYYVFIEGVWKKIGFYL